MDWIKTGYGQTFFQAHIPSIVNSLKRIADALERPKVDKVYVVTDTTGAVLGVFAKHGDALSLGAVTFIEEREVQ